MRGKQMKGARVQKSGWDGIGADGCYDHDTTAE